MHPAVYANESIYNEIPIYRQQVRQMKVAFLGNAQDESYKIGEQHIRNLFEKNVRPSLVDYLKTYLSEDEQ